MSCPPLFVSLFHLLHSISSFIYQFRAVLSLIIEIVSCWYASEYLLFLCSHVVRYVYVCLGFRLDCGCYGGLWREVKSYWRWVFFSFTFVKFFGCFWWVQLEWRKGKVNPIVRSIRSRLKLLPMPLNLVCDADGFPRIILTEPSGSSAEVLLYGGQVVSWKNKQREELLFKSSKAVWKPPKAIRGGIPVCFPQFGNLGSLDQHGFARNRLWSVDSDPSPLPPPNDQSSVDLILKSTEEDLKTWPRSFELRLHISLAAGKLILIPRVRNTDNKPFSFTFALCNYLHVSDISEVRVEGLETLDYFDNLLHRERFTEQADAITFDNEIDRVYLSNPAKIAIIDHEKKRTFVLLKRGMPDAAMWNPWDKKAKALPDLGDEDYKSMLRVDSAAIESPIVLKPFEEWKGCQELSTVSSSYCSGQLDPRKVLHGFK